MEPKRIIAMTVWGNRVSPVFDCSATLLIAETRGSHIVHRRFEPFNPVMEKQTADIFSRFQVDVLICGAITDGQSESLIKLGVQLIPFISGDAVEILESFLQH